MIQRVTPIVRIASIFQYFSSSKKTILSFAAQMAGEKVKKLKLFAEINSNFFLQFFSPIGFVPVS
jgi:hypothetical protein